MESRTFRRPLQAVFFCTADAGLCEEVSAVTDLQFTDRPFEGGVTLNGDLPFHNLFISISWRPMPAMSENRLSETLQIRQASFCFQSAGIHFS
jgi:hypothetical protein